MNYGKLVSGIAALAIYLGLIFLVLFFYNIHQIKAKNYVEKNDNRVTVTFVNSEKTVFNKKDKISNPKKPLPQVLPPMIKRDEPKKTVPKKVPPKKRVPKKVVPPKKRVPKKEVPKKAPPKKKTPKKTAKDLFSSVKTKDIKKRPIKRIPKYPVEESSRIKHNSSITDRIKATHQSGRLSNANREKGIENAYIAKVKRHMMNWNAVGAKGQWVTVNLTIFNSGKFKYTTSGVSGPMQHSLREYLNTLNRMGLGRHKKSTPYSIQVRFRVR